MRKLNLIIGMFFILSSFAYALDMSPTGYPINCATLKDTNFCYNFEAPQESWGITVTAGSYILKDGKLVASAGGLRTNKTFNSNGKFCVEYGSFTGGSGGQYIGKWDDASAGGLNMIATGYLNAFSGGSLYGADVGFTMDTGHPDLYTKLVNVIYCYDHANVSGIEHASWVYIDGSFSTHANYATGATTGELYYWFAYKPTANTTYALSWNGSIMDAPYRKLINFNSPANSPQANATPIIFNINCSDNTQELTIYFNFTGNYQNLTNSSDTFLWKANVTTEKQYNYFASCSNLVNSTVRYWSLDSTEPTIVLNSKNFFLADNTTQIQRNNANKNLNFTLTDNVALYGFEVNITDKNGVQKYYLLNETLTGTTAQVVKAVDFTAWALGNYTVKILASDAHTANKISPYSFKQITNGLEYNTAEGNKISLHSEGQSIAQTAKQTDRYTFDFNFNEKGSKARSIYLTSTNKIRYIEDSPYNGHFVIWNSRTKKGNWIDFEGAEKPTVLKISDYEYKVTFSSLEDRASFNSLGGLNVNEKDFRFELISLYPYNVSIIINNQIQWNNSGEYLSSELISFNISHINKILKNGCSCSGCSISGYNCLVPVIFTSDTIGRLNVLIKNVSYSYGLDNCTDTFKIPSNTTFNITTRSQDIGALLVTNTTFNINYWFNPAVTYSYNPVLNSKSSYKFCQYPAWANLSANMANNIRASGYYTLSHYLYNSKLTGVYNAYLAPIGGTYELITFLLIDSAGAGVEGATMKIYKTVGGSPTLIYERQSDFSGRVTAYLDQTYPYQFTINASGFPFKQFTLQPTSTSYSITLTSTGTSFYNNEYEGIRFRIWHNDQMGAPININISQQYQNISFQVEGTGLEAIGMALTQHNFICIPASCSAELATTTGGTVTVSIKANSTGLISTAYYFRRPGGTNTYVNDGVIKVVSFLKEATDSLMQLIAELKANTSPNTRTIISALVSITAVGVGASLGLFGYLLIIPAVLVNIGLGITGLINPTVAIIMTITGTLVFVFVSMKVQ